MNRILITYSPFIASMKNRDSFNLDRDILGTVLEVEKYLVEQGFNVKKIGIKRKSIGKFLHEINRFKPSVIFNLCEEVDRDSTKEKSAAALYELLGVPFTGNGSFALMVCLDKAMTKRILKSNGIPTPPFKIFADDSKGDLPFSLPAIVKPIHEDGSTGITARSVVRNHRNLVARIAYIHRKFKQPALVEKYLPGRELQVSLLGNRNPTILAVAELSYRGLPRRLPRIVTYSAKWKKNSRYYKYTNPIIPARIEANLQKRVEEISRKIFEMFNLRGYARIDFRVKGNKPFVIDVNPNPDLSLDAGFARAAHYAGLGYPRLVRRLVELALE